ARTNHPERAGGHARRGWPRERRTAGRARGGAVGDGRRAEDAAARGDVAGGHRARGAPDPAPLLRPRGGARVGFPRAPARLRVARPAGNRMGRVGAGDAAFHGGVRVQRPDGRDTAAEDPAALCDSARPRPARRAPEARLLAALRGGDGRRLPGLLRQPESLLGARLGRGVRGPARGRGGRTLGLLDGARKVRPTGRPLPRRHRRAAAARRSTPRGDSAGAGGFRGPRRGVRLPAGAPFAPRPHTRSARAPAFLPGPLDDPGLPRHARGARLPGHGRRPELGGARGWDQRGAGRRVYPALVGHLRPRATGRENRARHPDRTRDTGDEM
ncbi:MAG: Permease of the drug/metabolite transporter (DMT) superfamily, partial [uncultured Rubrobacteraceae bacterium]